jgi:NPCBM/NEW2 domain
MHVRAAPVLIRGLFAALILAIAGIYLWLATYGTWSLAGSELRGEAFDSLAKHLLRLDASVDYDAIDWEGLTVGSRTVMYFGPFPALLRIVPNLLFPSMYGLWSRVSCLLAALLSLAAALAIARAALTLDGRVVDRRSWIGLATVAVGFGLGTPVVYLVSCGRIYHESILWGLCGSLWGLYFIVRLLGQRISTVRGLCGLSVSFSVALLSRVTFAIPIAVALALLLVRALIERFQQGAQKSGRAKVVLLLVLAVSPAVVGGAFQLWYTHARFGSILDVVNINTYARPAEIGGVFNVRRIPSALRNYFGLTGRSFTRRPPFFQVARVWYGNNALFLGWKEETLSLSLGSSWLVLGALGGFLALLHRPRSALAIVVVILFGLQAVLISAYYFVTQRFSAEFLPLLMLLLFSAFFRVAAVPSRFTRLIWWFLPVLALGSAVVTVASTLQWNLAINDDVPREYKIRLSRLLDREGSVPRCRGRVVRLADLTPIAEHVSFAPMRKDTTWDGAPLVMDGVLYPSALGMHADASVTYVVPDGAVAFCAVVGLPDKSVGCPGGSVIFELRGQNGRLLYRSRTIRSGEGPESVFADLHGVDHLTLAATDAGDGITCDHASWGLPVFLVEPSAVSSK